MYRFFQRNQKKLLAIFGAFLMVVFILPTTFKSGSSGRENPVVAYVGDEKIHAIEAAQARSDWAAMRRINVRVGPFRQAPYPFVKLGRLALAIDQSPELFLLLQKEAQRQGINVSPDRVDNVVLNEFDVPGLSNPDDRERQRHAAEAFLLVETLYNRVLDNVKVSEPRVQRELALNEQEVRLNLVEFAASDYEKDAAPPTTQQVQEQFRRYAGVLPGQPTTAPSAGTLTFGYKYPNRVKLQYLTITKDQVRQAVKKTKSEYDWEVAAQRYYQTHPKDFPVTQPAPRPLGPAAPLAIPEPTTRPFGEVREQVMERVMQPEEARLMSDIRSAVLRRLATAYEQQSRGQGGKPTSAPATAPATAPASQPAGNASFAYLEQIAADIQKEFGVLPAVTSKADQWLTAEDLSKLPGIGSAWRESDNKNFANYVVQSAEAFMPVPGKADPSSVLSVLEPSDALTDVVGNVYVFRLTDAQAAHAPADVAEVRDRVESDVRAGRAYARAMDEAKKLLESAKKDRLPAAAAAAARNVLPTGFFSKGGDLGPTTIPNYPIDSDARDKFVNDAYEKLLALATPQNPHPVALIELPSEKRVLVAELGDVSSKLRPEQSFRERLLVALTLKSQEGQELAAQWFRPAAVKARLGYRSADPEQEKKEKEKEKESQNTEEAALD